MLGSVLPHRIAQSFPPWPFPPIMQVHLRVSPTGPGFTQHRERGAHLALMGPAIGPALALFGSRPGDVLELWRRPGVPADEIVYRVRPQQAWSVTWEAGGSGAEGGG